MNVTVKPLAVDIQTAGQMIGVSDGTIKMLIRASETSGFPKPKKLSANRVGIIVKELEAWVDTRPESDLLPPVNCGKKKKPATNDQATQDDQKAA